MRILTLGLLLVFACKLLATPLKKDTSLLTGSLDNGFTYTIKQHAFPKDKAEFRLLVKAGSLEEDDDQKGVAHLVEHMAFNGSKHFEKNSLVSFLESMGVSFGSHLNASTGTERTLYKLSVPLKNDNLEKSFLVFEDWAGGLVFSQEELDKERGVILEEARSRENVGLRLYKQYKGLFYGGSKYNERLPIGDMDIIKNISLERVKAFYDDWYRPELMHFVAVGDFDETKVEELIKKHFSKLKNKSTRQRSSRLIPFAQQERLKFALDSELTSNALSLYFLHEGAYNTNTQEQYKQDLIRTAVIKLFNQEVAAQLYKKDPVVKSMAMGSYRLGDNQRAFVFRAPYQGKKEKEALFELSKQLYNTQTKGFSKQDVQRVQKMLLSSYENSFKALKTRTSAQYANMLTQDAFYERVSVDETFEYELATKLIKTLNKEELNQFYQNLFTTPNKVTLYTLAQANILSKAAIKQTLAKAKASSLEKGAEKSLPKQLLANTLVSKPFISKVHNKNFDFYEYTLANGIKVVFKQTNFEKNRVRITGFSKGGLAAKPQKILACASYVPSVISKSGVGEFNALELEKIYAGKSFSIRPYISRFSEGFSGSASPKDFDALLEMLYMFNTDFKVNDNVLSNIKTLALNSLKEQDRDPNARFSKELLRFYYANNPRMQEHQKSDIEAIKKEDILQVYKSSFKDAQNFTYVIVGDIQQEALEKLLNTYLANLRPQKKQERNFEENLKPLSGEQRFVRYFNKENISRISLSYLLEKPYSFEDEIKLSAMRDVLSVKLRELIREEKSGVYGVSVHSKQSRLPYERTKVSISFSCDPKRKEELVTYVKSAIKALQSELVDEHYIKAFTNKKLTAYKQALQSNDFWQNRLIEHYFYGQGLENLRSYEQKYKAISNKDVLEASKKYLLTKDTLYTELNPKALEN